MSHRKTPPYPEPHPELFHGEIRHPNLLLWDSWVMRVDGDIHMYCLALSRCDHDGSPITSGMCNDYRFHFRHFVSDDEGASWRDCGVVLNPGNVADGSDTGNVWSGGVLPLDDGSILFGFTGIGDASDDHRFVQSINFAIGTPDGPEIFAQRAASHPVRDRDHIVSFGYYLPTTEQIGHNNGEDNGPITAWRDPFLYRDVSDEIFVFWSAKIGPRKPCVAWGKVEVNGDNVALKLLPPITLPDEDDYTQSEVPKVCRNTNTGKYYMMISACNRLHEQQPDEEIFKQLRLYESDDLAGPWIAYNDGENILTGLDYLFGASFLDTEFAGDDVRVIAPTTAKIGPELELTFAPVKTITL